MKVALVAGARPNFMKVAPLARALESYPAVSRLLIHTGQHYDPALSDVFFRELELPEPDVWLEVGSASHAQQTARVMQGFEQACLEHRPDVVVVVGDVNSTVAAALVSAKLGIRLAHVEAGLRSRDRSMPEEINRLVTDVLADELYTTSADADENLRNEGIPAEKIHLVGNVMVDSLLTHLPAAQRRDTLQQFNLLRPDGTPVPYAVLTLHRPSNVDVPDTFAGLMRAVAAVATEMPIIFPVHPRTRRQMPAESAHQNVRLVEPQGYLDFLALTSRASLILTDSGGLQEESTALGIPCLTLRENTERPVTVTLGTNIVVGTDPDRIVDTARRALADKGRRGQIPPLWDGHAAERIIATLLRGQN